MGEKRTYSIDYVKVNRPVETLVYSNELAKLKFRSKLTATEVNLWSTIVSLLNGIGNEEVKICLKEFSILAKYGLSHRAYKGLINDIETSIGKVSELMSDSVSKEVVLFEDFNIEDYMLSLRVSEEYIHYFNNPKPKKDFSIYELGNIVHLKSEYSKELYRVLMASSKRLREDGKSIKYCKINMRDLRDRLEIPKSYRIEHIRQKVFQLSKSELTNVNPLGVTPFEWLEIKEVRAGGARGDIDIEFRFLPTPPRAVKEVTYERRRYKY